MLPFYVPNRYSLLDALRVVRDDMVSASLLRLGRGVIPQLLPRAMNLPEIDQALSFIAGLQRLRLALPNFRGQEMRLLRILREHLRLMAREPRPDKLYERTPW